jgi:hypothetical protein
VKIVESAKKRADWDFEDTFYDRNCWVAEVAAKDTQLGYFDWVVHKLEAEEESGL